eukprot:gene13027-8873_t
MHYHINLSANSVRTLILIYYTTTSQTHHTPTISNLSSTLHKLSNEPPLTINITYKRTQHKQLSTHCPSVYHNQNLQSINTPLVAYPHNILNQTRVATHAQCEVPAILKSGSKETYHNSQHTESTQSPTSPTSIIAYQSKTQTLIHRTHPRPPQSASTHTFPQKQTHNLKPTSNTPPTENKPNPQTRNIPKAELNKQMTLTTYTEQHTQYLHYAAYSTHPSKLYCTYYTEAAHKTTISAARRIGTDKDNLNVKAQIMRLNTHINANQAKQYTAFPNTSCNTLSGVTMGTTVQKQTHSDSN